MPRRPEYTDAKTLPTIATPRVPPSDDAFLALVIEKGYEKTTIQDILDRADVGRSTFYAHFRDKEALLMASFDGMSRPARA